MSEFDFNALVKMAEKYGCAVLENAEIKPYTTFKIGGKVRALIKINSAECCRALIEYCGKNKIPKYVLGRCSNVLADDRDINAAVLLMSSDFGKIEADDKIIRCEAGAQLTRVCTAALENSLSGLEFAYGIPGSVGGAVYMNAGAYGGEIKDVVKSVKAVSADGIIRTFTAEEMELSYRKSAFADNGYTVLEAEFELQYGDKSAVKARMNELMDKRRDKQPLEFPSAGSTFKRPEGSFASLLIDQCGLKGLTVGGAQVSNKHSGFVINKGDASFDDVINLIIQIKKIVFEKTGYRLECEPVIISDREVFGK